MKAKSVVGGIDFGTANSGFAYAYTNCPDTIFIQDLWEGGSFNSKTLTQIVLNEKTRKCEAFGYQARDYIHDTDEDPESHPFFAFYKMHLFDQKNRAQPVKSINSSKSVTAQELITETLKYLKDCLLKKINGSSCTIFRENDIQWVLTIPAIWDDSSKQVMRSCADKAGLCSKDDKESLIFSYEPEAGALQCIYEKTSGFSVAVGEKFMVIDNGGGTSDIMAYKQLEGKKLMSISRSFGGDYGSIYVNNIFIKFLVEFFAFNGDSTSNTWIDLNPMALFHKDVDWLNNKIDTFNKRTDSNIKFSPKREKLFLTTELFKSFFTPIFNNITNCIKNEMKSNGDINNLNYIFLIGGFNDNKWLQEHIKNELQFTGAKFIIPSNTSLAVVMGAVRFGLNPDTISQRVQSRSYATEILEEVSTEKSHSGKMLFSRNGKQYCPNVCDVFVSKDQLVGFDEIFSRSYMPSSPDQKSIEISIFSSHSTTMAYTTDPGVQFIGQLYVQIPNPGAPIADNRVDVCMKFATTEIEVGALHIKSGLITNCTFDFALDEAESLRRNKLHQEKNKPPKVQLCTMMDCTGSMGSWIAESKKKMIELNKSLVDVYLGLELNVSFIGYRDHSDEDRFEIVPFTTNMTLLESRISSMVAKGGGDAPEDIAGAFTQANSLTWKPDHTKLIVHVGDAPCHGKKYHNLNDSYPEGDPSGLVPEKILQTLSGKGIDYYFIKINSSTDKMIEIFKTYYDSPQKKIVVQDLGSDVSKLLPSLVKFVTSSITRYSQ